MYLHFGAGNATRKIFRLEAGRNPFGFSHAALVYSQSQAKPLAARPHERAQVGFYYQEGDMNKLYQFLSHVAWVCIALALGGVVAVAIVSAYWLAMGR